ncbi:MAG: DUF3293 domain-containing protein [Planctomycetes bacterium]|nr:DUF3293 domain-containing protein [Planctomycetota bacterium]
MSQLDPNLIQAYRDTHFVVSAQPAFTLRIGMRSEALAALHRERGCISSAYVTACNPLSQELTDESNAERMKELRAVVEDADHQWIEGVGRDPEGKWPGEPSLLVLGVTRAACEALGRQFDQNAVVFAGEDATPELVLLR